MQKKCFMLMGVFFLLGCLGAGRAEAFVFIHEFLADPASGLAGDANNDGIRDSYDDEFIELFNLSSEAVDISGWSVSDSVAQRHEFDAGTEIQANSVFVLFGGGTPNLPGIDWQVLFAGSLNLNNSGDTIILRDSGGTLIDAYTYGSEAGNNQSITRNPEGSKGGWSEHTLLPGADGRLFSPGFVVNPVADPTTSRSTVPEPATLVLMGTGLFGMATRKRKASKKFD